MIWYILVCLCFYVQLDLFIPSPSSDLVESSTLSLFWASWLAYKVLVFSLQLMQDRLPSMKNLFKQKATVDSNMVYCSMCAVMDHSWDKRSLAPQIFYFILYRESTKIPLVKIKNYKLAITLLPQQFSFSISIRTFFHFFSLVHSIIAQHPRHCRFAPLPPLTSSMF